jgi:hypothetical protein
MRRLHDLQEVTTYQDKKLAMIPISPFRDGSHDAPFTSRGFAAYTPSNSTVNEKHGINTEDIPSFPFLRIR